MVLAILSASSAQVQGDKPPSSPGTPAPLQVVPRRAAPLPPATVEETTLPVPPTVQWDGKLLTVDAENSKLSDVLVAIRDKTGARLELSGDPARERVFVHLGPGPAREIISDLLYGTQFDYIVLASDDDPDALRSVVVTPRGRDDISIDTVVAGAADTDTETGGKDSTQAAGSAREGGGARERAMRLMPGYSGPSKPTFQAEAEASLAEKAAQEDAPAADTSEASANAQNPSADSAGSQDAKNDQPSSSPAVSSPAASTTGTDLPPATEGTPSSSSSSSSSASNSNDPSGVGSMIQNMTRMFEQRRQIQAQQNQPPQQPSSN